MGTVREKLVAAYPELITVHHCKENVPSGPSQHQAGVPLVDPPAPIRGPGAGYVDCTQEVFFCQKVLSHFHTRGTDPGNLEPKFQFI